MVPVNHATGTLRFQENEFGGYYYIDVPQRLLLHLQKHFRIRRMDDVELSDECKIAVIKAETPNVNHSQFGQKDVGAFYSFTFSNDLVHDRRLLYLDICCDDACELRRYFGLTALRDQERRWRVRYHLTLGRRYVPDDSKKNANRISMGGYQFIDATTLTQHL